MLHNLLQSCGGLEYAVKPGDTCNSIAAKFGMSCVQVRALNPKSFSDNGDPIVAMRLCIGKYEWL